MSSSVVFVYSLPFRSPFIWGFTYERENNALIGWNAPRKNLSTNHRRGIAVGDEPFHWERHNRVEITHYKIFLTETVLYYILVYEKQNLIVYSVYSSGKKSNSAGLHFSLDQIFYFQRK